MNPDPSREATLFAAAAELPPAERAAYLDRECAGDAALRTRVEALLRNLDAPENVLDRPPGFGPTGTLATPVTEKAGDKIGHYKLLQQIGEGGCGVVYMAEQEEPVRRRVALKVIKLGMDTKQVVARFEAERQALAMMDHPNIARVLDAGATDTGRPYFVMELVRGTRITEFCDQQKLSTRERLDLFMQVCSAIQHAHQKAIIHRDLKPSNVLVTMIDGKPVPKVIDFGIAKATNQQRLTDKTLFTAFEQFIGTPAYMSPEQAEMSGVDIDTRSDIYSLGVLLYELLTGATPFDAEQLINSGLDGIRKTLREQEPLKPSTRLNTLANADLNTVAAQRHTEAPKLVHTVRGDLDWVVMKCLDKDRTRRYESASGLAADIQRHLDSQPIVARPPSALYLLQKMARRHRLAFTAGTAVVAALVIGVSVAAISLLRERETFRAWEDAAQAAHRGWKRAYTALRETEAAKAKTETALTQAEASEANARQERDKANTEKQRADQQATIAQAEADRASRLLYIAHMNLAKAAWDDANTGRVLELLEQHRPKPGQPDLRGFEWFYLDRLCHSDLLTLNEHTNMARSVAFSPDGKRLASASSDRTVKVWDITSGHATLTLKGHASGVESVVFSRDGKRLASASSDRTVKVWNATNGRETFTLRGHTATVASVAFSPDGKRLASASYDRTVKVWDATNGQEMLTLKGHADNVHSVAFSPDGKRLVSASFDRTVKVWDTASGQETLTLKGHAYGVWSVVFSPDGKRLASAGEDRTVKVWDAANGQDMLTLKGHTLRVKSVAFSLDGKRLASASADRTVKVWDAIDGQEVLTLKGHRDGIESVAFSPDGKRLASVSLDKTVKVWDITSGQETLMLKDHTDWVVSVVFSPDGKRLASASSDRTVKVYDASSREKSSR